MGSLTLRAVMCRIPFMGSCLLPCEWTPTGGRGACWGLGHWFNRSIPGNSDRGGFSILLSCVLFKAVCDITHWETLHFFLPVKFSKKKNHAFSETRGFLFFFLKLLLLLMFWSKIMSPLRLEDIHCGFTNIFSCLMALQ